MNWSRNCMQVGDLLVSYSVESGIVKFGIRNTTTQGNFLGRDKKTGLEDRLKLTVTVWHKIFVRVCFCRLVIFSVLRELIFAIRRDCFFLLGINGSVNCKHAFPSPSAWAFVKWLSFTDEKKCMYPCWVLPGVSEIIACVSGELTGLRADERWADLQARLKSDRFL